MGTNIHAFAHRLIALSMACLASTGFICCCFSGFGCSFIKIEALEGESIGNAFGDVYEDVETSYLGVQCLSRRDAPFYDVDDNVDRLWKISRSFFYIGLALGATTALFAWLLGSFIRPTVPRWRVLSILAACSAVFQIPIFLVFESDNCNFDVTRQTCELGSGAYLNVLSVSIWIVMTIWVQCLRAPRWDEELDAWRVKGNTVFSSSLPGKAGIAVGNKIIQSKRSEDTFRVFGGNETVETAEAMNSPPRNVRPLKSLCSPRKRCVEKTEDIEKQLEQQVTKEQSPMGAEKVVARNDKESSTIGRFGITRPDEPVSITNTVKQNLSNKKDIAKNTRLSFVKSMKNNIQRVRSSSGKNATRGSFQVGDPSSNFQPLHHEQQIAPKRYTEPSASTGHNVGAVGDKSETVDTGEYAVNQPQNVDSTASQSPPSNRTAPGFHLSCVHADGTRQEVHFPSLTCCVGMGDPTVEEEETEFQTYPQISDDLDVAEFDDYMNFGTKNSDSADFLVRKLRKEEQAAAARRAELNMAPVASFEFVTRNSIVNGDPRKCRNNYHHETVINDDVSEMTRGSGWASGVSEILDDTDLRHQPKAILEDLTDQY